MTSTNLVDPVQAQQNASPAQPTGALQENAGRIKGLCLLLIVIALFVIIRALPMDRAIGLLNTKIDGLGVWGPLVLGGVYIVATVLFFPGSALTLAGGGVFGVGLGTLIVSIASTTSAALSFLIARYLARDKVAAQAQRYPKFRAIDGAIGAGGWKIIAMLRLSPAVPFSLGNYLYGLTSIRFWPYVLASWIFMLPGTVMYVYLGHVGTEGLRSASGAEGGKSPAQWALLGIGLLATIAVSVYVTRLSKKALREQTQIEEQPKETPSPSEQAKPTSGSLRGVAVLAFVAVAMLTAAAYTNQNRDALRGLFGPAPVTLHEAYQPKPAGPKFDHTAFDALLRQHVDDDGWINYEGFRSDAASLDAYIATLAQAPFAELGRNEKLALLINAYNAFTIRLILDHYPIESIKDIASAKRWDAKRWHLGTMTLSLNQIEHEQIRPKFAEPRIHFALVCAAVGCPKLRNEAYRADRIDAQLEDQSRYVHTHDRWFRYKSGTGKIHLTKLYNWYGADFKQVAGSVLEFAARYSTPLKSVIAKGKKPSIKWLDYDWKLNDRKNSH